MNRKLTEDEQCEFEDLLAQLDTHEPTGHACNDELRRIDEKFKGWALPPVYEAYWEYLLEQVEIEKLVRSRREKVNTISQPLCLDPVVIPTSAYSSHVEMATTIGGDTMPFIVGDNRSMSADEFYAYRDRLQAEIAATTQYAKHDFERNHLKNDRPGQIMVLGKGATYEEKPVGRRILSCPLCGSEYMGRCGKPTCLGLTDEEWAWRDLREWWDGLAPDPADVLPVDELEDRIWAALTDPPKKVRSGATTVYG